MIIGLKNRFKNLHCHTSRSNQRRRAPLVSGLVLSAGCWLSVASAESVNISPETLIRDMSQALTNLNYEGSFVHMQNGNIESMSIVHSNDHGGEMEYMLSLNGEAREVFRDKSLVTCIWPNSQSVIVSESKKRKILPNVDESLTNSETYQLSLGKPDRVAGIETHVIDIKPKDQFRYGYRFWVDKNTNMLLRSMLVDSDDNAIEQVMFTTISYPESIAKERFTTPNKVIESYNKNASTHTPILADNDNRVKFESLPVGYSVVSETYQATPINDGPVSHVMLSDGMASVSVYVEYVDAAQQDATLGMSTMGAMNAYTRSVQSALITVVGEVPSATVESIAGAVQLVE